MSADLVCIFILLVFTTGCICLAHTERWLLFQFGRKQSFGRKAHQSVTITLAYMALASLALLLGSSIPTKIFWSILFGLSAFYIMHGLGAIARELYQARNGDELMREAMSVPFLGRRNGSTIYSPFYLYEAECGFLGIDAGAILLLYNMFGNSLLSFTTSIIFLGIGIGAYILGFRWLRDNLLYSWETRIFLKKNNRCSKNL